MTLTRCLRNVTLTLSLGAIALAALPAQAQTGDSLVGQCRAANRPTPIFSGASTLTTALRIIGVNEQVTLAGEAQDGLIAISRPIQGYVQTGVLKACTTPPPPPRTSCRLLENASVANVRREPNIPEGNGNANVVGQALRGDRVYVVLRPNGSVSSAVADGYNWVEIDTNRAPFNRPGTGWMFNSRVGSSTSNLVYCPN